MTPNDETRLIAILQDISLSLRILSGRSTVTKVENPNSYKAKYFSRTEETKEDK